jgi:hypothetical protein
MAKYPVEYTDDEGVVDAVNYLLSGPAGLGQNFQGFSAYLPAYIRPKGKQPWSLPIDTTLNPSIYLNIPLSNAAPVGGNPSRLVKFTFASPQPTVPFEFGDGFEVYNVVESGAGESYNYADGWTVYECTTTDVTIVTSVPFTWPTYVSGGWGGRDFMNFKTSTDCNGRVTVSGATTQVFVSAQINLAWTYDCSVADDYSVNISINRLKGFPSDAPGSNDYLFANSVLVSEKTFLRNATVGSGADALEAIFTTVLDGPNLDFGYYWYILEVKFNSASTGSTYHVAVGKATTGLRSLTAQVIKQ